MGIRMFVEYGWDVRVRKVGVVRMNDSSCELYPYAFAILF